MASEATKKAVRDNMHLNTRVIKVIDFKSEIKFDLRPWSRFDGLRCHQKAIRGNMHINIWVVEESEI